jgi:predicted ribosomally synthesized peptide with nif11-like leader
MSQIHIEKFYEIAANDQALLGQLIGGTSSPEDFVEKAVAAAKERGLNFSAEEANTWIAAQQAIKANGELSDTQLEDVAGGKGWLNSASSAYSDFVFNEIGTPVLKARDDVGSAVSSGANSAVSAVSSGANSAVSWVSSW